MKPSNQEKLIINFTPTGMIPTKEMTQHVPISVSEIVEQVHEAYELGITLVHLHARDKVTGKPTYKKDVYQEILEGIRLHCPALVLGLSLSGRDFNEFEKRSEPIELEPDMGSLTLSSLNFSRQASINSPDTVKQLATKMGQYGVKPELEVFDLGMINYAHYLIQKGLIGPPYYFNLLFGNVSGMQATPSQIGTAISELPANSYWSLAGIGQQQITANAMAIACGGGVRIGLEDNIYLDKNKSNLASNKQLIKRIHQLAEIHERPIMKPEEFGALGFYNEKRLIHQSQ